LENLLDSEVTVLCIDELADSFVGSKLFHIKIGVIILSMLHLEDEEIVDGLWRVDSGSGAGDGCIGKSVIIILSLIY